MSSSDTPRKAKVFLVDDHPLIRDHLAALIRREPDLTVCGEAEDAPSALAQIVAEPPDLVVLDLSLRASHGLDLLKQIRARHPKLPVLVLSMHDELLYAERALHAGALGYITKQAATANILTALRRVLRGEVYLSERMAARIMRRVIGTSGQELGSPLDILTDRELEVFQMIGRGLGTRRIAEELRLGIKTVESYKGRIKEKLGLTDATQLLQHAIHWVQSQGG
ncbi:MAG: response regulator transcription factor [Verrucomicrobiales bacterium]|nr:response regulator transcription factor [Verrucomicrobiales bacterium]